ncbi:MAG TPA: transcription elongation factor GreA [Dehalococcoidia bacterium]|jgi:transcription elongation factor GreA|nr:transcription elongation factor GreA [Dehalococcoidia bacterium]
MAGKPIPLTEDGLAKLQKELDELVNVRRAEVAQRIHDAKELVGAQNAPEYEDARAEQAFVEGRIIELETMLQNAVMIDEKHRDHQKVSLGSRVEVKDHKGKKAVYTIVGVAEADPREGKISNESPVGTALLGKKVGDKIDIKAPAGDMTWTIVKID